MTTRKQALFSRDYAVTCAFAVKTRPRLTAICSLTLRGHVVRNVSHNSAGSDAHFASMEPPFVSLFFHYNPPNQTRAVSINPLDWFV